MIKPTAAQLAQFDQAYASTVAALTTLIDTYTEALAEGHHRAAVIAATADYLEQRVPHGDVAQVLSVAIAQLGDARDIGRRFRPAS